MDSPSPALNIYNRLRNIAKLFRFIELISVLSFLLWLSSQLPFAVKISGEYCRRFSAFVFHPISIFVLGNSIVLALLAKSGLFNGNGHGNGNFSDSVDIAVDELIEELRSDIRDGDIPVFDEEIIFQDKEIICEDNPKKIAVENEAIFSEEVKKPSEIAKKSYRRTQSENIRTECEEITEKSEKKLRRSETEVLQRDFGGGGGESTAEELEEDDNMSNEEFQRTIEAFIAKQIKFHRQERLAVVLHGQA